MQANPSKFPFMFLKHFRCNEDIPDIIEIDNVTVQIDVKLLKMTLDDKLRFSKRVDILCERDARQLSIMHRFKIYLTSRKNKQIYNTFILANLNYCPAI